MNAIRKNATRGFTLVEILIVVIILGILAAIVIPQFTNASTDARRNSTSSLLQTLRSQLELYKLQHGDTKPNIVGNTAAAWDPLTKTSTYAGTTFGPYMQQIPKNPLNGQSGVINGDGTAAPTGATTGFVYDYAAGAGTGKIWATGTVTTAYFNEANPSAGDIATAP